MRTNMRLYKRAKLPKPKLANLMAARSQLWRSTHAAVDAAVAVTYVPTACYESTGGLNLYLHVYTKDHSVCIMTTRTFSFFALAHKFGNNSICPKKSLSFSS